MIDTTKWNIDFIGEKIIKPMYENGAFPLTLADEIKSAIEKQIPKKVLNIQEDWDIDSDFFASIQGNCPACGENLVTYCFQKHCDNCGQAIDWSVEE